MPPFIQLLTFLLLASPLSAQSSRLKVDLPHFSADLGRLEIGGFDVISEYPEEGWAEIILTDSDLPRLNEVGFHWELLEHSRPLREILEGDLDLDSRYHTPYEIQADLLAWENAYPSLAQRVDLTVEFGLPSTWNGRHIYALKISDNVALDEDESTVLCVGNHHAREIQTPEAMFDIIERLLTGYAGDPQIASWVNEKEFWILPTLNPDGLDYVWNVDNWWRKNRRANPDGSYGVDLNRNYPFKWATCGNYSTTYSSEVYVGPSPFSEPETQTLAALASREHFSLVIDDHSYGQEVLYPYTCGNMPSQVQSIVRQYMHSARAAASYDYRYASSGGEHFEWQFNQFGALSFLFEISTSFQPTWSSTESELVQIWPAMAHLFDAELPLSGHVTNSNTGAPIEAHIKLLGVDFTENEIRQCESEFGRYHFWVQSGVYDIEVSASGYLSKTLTGVSIDAVTGTQLEVTLDGDVPVHQLINKPTPGDDVYWLVDNSDAWIGDTAYILLSGTGGGAGGGFSLPDGSGRVVPLIYDRFTDWSISHPIRLGALIGVNGTGATSLLTIPRSIQPGANFWSAAVLVDPYDGAYDALTEEILIVIQ